MQPRRDVILLALIALLFLAWFSAPLLVAGTENARLVATFDTDEAKHVGLIRAALDAGNMRLDFHGYGHLYFNLILVPLHVVQTVSPVSDRTIIVCLRAVSVIAAWLLVMLTFASALRLFGRVVAWVAALLTLCVPLELLRYAAISHPDVLQVLFVLGSLHVACTSLGETRLSRLVVAALLAGLAFSTKYSGLFLLPVLFALVAARAQLAGCAGRAALPVVVFRCVIGAASLVLFGVALLVTPDLVMQRLRPNNPLSASQLHALGLLRAGCGTLAGIGLILSVLPVAWRWLAQRARLRVCLTECAILLGVFLVAFALTSPYLLPLRVVKGLMAESVHVGFGHSFASESGVTTWLHVLASGDVLGRSIAALAAIGLAAQAWRWFRRRDRLSPRSVLWAWVALYIVYLFARVSMTEARYLFVVVPVLMILVAELAVGWVARLAQRRWRHVALAAAAGLAVLLVIAPAWTRAARYRSERLSRVGTSCAVQAGNWIAAHYPASMRIAHDAYAYIPPQFAATQWHWAWTQDDLARFEPDLIVVHQEMRRRFADPARADLYVHGAERYWATADYYRRLEEQRGFRLVRDLGDVQIYTSNSDAAAGRVSSTALAPE